MGVQARAWRGTGVAALVAAAVLAGGSPAKAAAVDYPDVQIAAFWNSTQDTTDSLYMSANGVDFQQIGTPFKVVNGHVEGMPSYVQPIRDPGLTYSKTTKTFWISGGYTQWQGGSCRFTPMLASSKDLNSWSCPNSGSATNLVPSVMPASAASQGGGFDSCGTELFVDDNGDGYIVTTLGYFAGFHGGSSADDRMQPYIVKVSGLRAGANKEAQPILTYGRLDPITGLDASGHDWLDPSLYKEGNTYYLSIKKNGVTNQIYSSTDPLANNWKLVCADVVTGYEAPCLTKYKGQYYMYTDKLADYPAGAADGRTGTFVTESGSLTGGWHATRRITTTNVDGRSVPNRHGTVITITDPEAKAVIFRQRERAGYGTYEPGLQGWVTKGSAKYWYDEGIMAVSKEIYDPGSDAWYWLDKDGSKAVNKDVYIPAGDKWVRYDEEGHMRKGLEFRYGAWYYFDPITGEMLKGNVYVPEWGGWHWFDLTTGRG